MQIHEHFFLDGTWHTPVGSDTVEVVSPASEEVIGRVPLASKADVGRAVGFARAAFDDGPWPRLTVAERVERVRALASAIAARTDAFADVLCDEQGLTRHGLPAGQIAKTVANLTTYADIAERFEWTVTRPGATGRTLSVRRVPVGVVAAIVPWNAPLMVASMKLAPALVAGCTAVLKPPVETPLHTYLLAEAAIEAGLPAGVLNILPADAEVSEQLVRSDGIDKVSFTGSTAVGRQVGAICGGDLRRCTLELGGKSAAVLLDDFQPTPANIAKLVLGAMVNTGQVCSAMSRVLVPRRLHDEVVAAMATAAASLAVGDPRDPGTTLGPLISRSHRERVERYIASGVDEGAVLATGGGRPDIERGWYVQPTVFADVQAHMTVAREEIFGPVAAVLPYDGGDDDAIRLANDSTYGLAGSVYTTDVQRGAAVAARIRTGAVAVNAPGALDVCGPFGGFKQSGIGREGGREGLADYTELQTILLPEGLS